MTNWTVVLYYQLLISGQVLVCITTHLHVDNHFNIVFWLGIHHMIELTGSLMLSMALLMAKISVPEASWLTRLETEFQVVIH